MNAIVSEIRKTKKPCYFISPHLDDAALSCGELMRELAKFTKVTVITVFTGVTNGSPTLSAKQAVLSSGYPTQKTLYAERASEDKKALASIKVSVVHLSEIEALWRKKSNNSGIIAVLSRFIPEFKHIYPTYRWHIAKGKISRHDTETINRVARVLKKTIKHDAVVFAPLGIGDHVDHIVTKKAAEKFFHPYYWVDQPYYTRSKAKISFTERALIRIQVDMGRKSKLLSSYRTQIPLLFSTKRIPVLKEYIATRDIYSI
jgi:LmbE family N-acetylglucosaminyl deacetylase